jgi:hypothetical protein
MTIPTYFSHSYRLEDQALNQKFWRVFSEAGFSFFVDPPSDSTIHTYLERMMGRCSAFVAVVNRRLDVSRFFCSRFILFEYGLSIQARHERERQVGLARFEDGLDLTAEGPLEVVDKVGNRSLSAIEPVCSTPKRRK